MQSENSSPTEVEKSGLARFANSLSFVSGALAGAAVVLILAVVCAEMLLRNLLGTSLLIGDELCGYLNVAVIFLGLGYTLREGGFIRVELLYDAMSHAWRAASRWFFVLTSIVFVCAMLYYSLKHLIYLFEADIRSDGLTEMLLYIPQIPVVVGSAVLLVQLLSYVFGRMNKVP